MAGLGNAYPEDGTRGSLSSGSRRGFNGRVGRAVVNRADAEVEAADLNRRR